MKKFHLKAFVTSTLGKSILGLLLLGCVYLMAGFTLQNKYWELLKEKRDAEQLSEKLRSEILLADLELNKLTSLERIRPLADSLGLSFREPAQKVRIREGK